MDFGSPYVYNYDQSDEECISDDEFDEGMTLSDSEESEEEVNSGNRTGATHNDGRKRGRWGYFGKLSSRFFSHQTPSKSEETTPPPSSAPGHHKKLAATGPVSQKLRKRKKHHWRTSSLCTDVTQQQKQEITGRKWRRADTNVVSVKFDHLISPNNMHTGDAVYCAGCKAILSHLSKLGGQGEEKLWVCEYCGEHNKVDLMDEEIPKQHDVTYMLQPAPSTTASGKSGTDESLVIFCMDVSGSMCVTTEVPGKIHLRGVDRLSGLQSLNDTHEDQYIPGQKRNVTYISRLQGMQAAVDHQVGQMEKEHPNRRVSLVTFNNEVTVIGDGTTVPVTVAGDKLSDKDELVKIGRELALPKAVRKSRKTLGEKIFELEEGGATALGPSLLLSVSMACQVPGSKVIICTDGLANVGLGSLDVTTEEAFEEASMFYSDVGTMAKEKGVSVSVISIKGTDCKMVELGKVADCTTGQVNIVDPLKLTQEFGNILADPIIATNVTATLLVHKQLYIRLDNTQESTIMQQVGNVTCDTVVTFEYGVRHNSRQKNKEHTDASATKDAMEAGPSTSSGETSVSLDNIKELPFQLKIKYTDLEGAEALRVLSQVKPVTKKREVAEKALNIGVLGTHAAQKSANMAMGGHYSESRLNALVNQRLVSRNCKGNSEHRRQYKTCFTPMQMMENQLNHQQKDERRTFGRSHSDNEDEDDLDVLPSMASTSHVAPKTRAYSVQGPSSNSKPKKRGSLQMRTFSCTDDQAKLMYRMRRASLRTLSESSRKSCN